MQTPDFTSAVQSQLNSANANELASHVNSSSSPLNFNPTPGSQRWTLGYAAGSHLPDAALRAGFLRPLKPLINNLGTDNMRSGLAGAGLGAVAGAGISLAGGGDPARGALAGAGVGGLGMLMMSMYARRKLQNTNYHQTPLPQTPSEKFAFYGVMSADGSDIEDRVMQDNSLNYMDKTTLLRYVEGLNPQQKSSLSLFLGPMAGAGIGMAVARYLLKMGIGGIALMGIVGGAVGNNLSGGSRNAFGQRNNTKTDMFGQNRFI